MSQDQVIGILLGLKYVSVFVDNVFIKPTSTDEGFNLQDMSKQIAQRIIDFIHERKDCGPQIDPDCSASNAEYVADASIFGNCNIENVNARWIIKNPVTGKAAIRGPSSYLSGLGFGNVNG